MAKMAKMVKIIKISKLAKIYFLTKCLWLFFVSYCENSTDPWQRSRAKIHGQVAPKRASLGIQCLKMLASGPPFIVVWQNFLLGISHVLIFVELTFISYLTSCQNWAHFSLEKLSKLVSQVLFCVLLLLKRVRGLQLWPRY